MQSDGFHSVSVFHIAFESMCIFGMAYKLFMAKEDGQKLDTKLLLLCLENKLMTGATQGME